MDAKLKTKPSSKVIRPDEITSLLQEGEFGAMLDFTVTDKDGKVTRHESRKSESYVVQFLQLLMIQIGNMYNYVDSMATKDTGGVYRAIHKVIGGVLFNCMGNNGDNTLGIVVGTNTTPVTINDSNLLNLIVNGTGAGQLQYSNSALAAPSADSSTSQLTITRNFANGSGATITVNEIGLYVYAREGSPGWGGTDRCICIIRDVISGGIDVPNGQTLTVNYRPQATI